MTHVATDHNGDGTATMKFRSASPVNAISRRAVLPDSGKGTSNNQKHEVARPELLLALVRIKSLSIVLPI